MSFLNEIQSRIDKAEIVSFDIFDTLLVRPYAKPTDLFRHMEQHFNASGFHDARISAEAAARKTHDDYEEVTLNQIYEEIDAQYKDFYEKEKDFERQILIPNPKVKEVFDYAKSKGKKIIVISDMYLDGKFLHDVLKEKGYTGISKCYVSSDYKKMKMTGTLFPVVIKDQGIEPSKILHIGDNFQSDYAIPFSYGFDASFFYKNIDCLFQHDVRVPAFYEKNKDNLGISIILGMLSYIYATDESNYWKIFGFKYAGPIIFAYMEWLMQKLQDDNISDVMFIARDGYTLQKVFDILDENKDFNSNYVYASRMFDTLFNMPYKQKIAVDPIEGLSTLKKIIYYYKDKNPILKSETPANITSCDEGVEFIEKHLDIYEALATRKKADYAKYINQFMNHNKVAMVDTLSIHMSSQRLLTSFCKNNGVELYGYYFAVEKSPKVDYSDKIFRTFQKSFEWQFIDWDFCEFLITSPESPIQDISLDGTPIYKKQSLMEKTRSEAYKFVSEGAVMFAQLAKQFFGNILLNLRPEDVTMWINEFCLIPTELDKAQITHIKHGYDSNHDTYVPICKPWFNNCGADQTNTGTTIRKYKLFDCLPILKTIRGNGKYEIRMFNIIPIIKIKQKWRQIYLAGIPIYKISITPTRKVFRLFKLIPILAIKG